jgi:hypothetical protein
VSARIIAFVDAVVALHGFDSAVEMAKRRPGAGLPAFLDGYEALCGNPQVLLHPGMDSLREKMRIVAPPRAIA